jgi:hypothetical protein
MPLVSPGDNLASLLLTSLQVARINLEDGDILVIAQKIVSKAENRLINLCTVIPSKEAFDLAKRSEKDPRLVELILRESREVLRVRPGIIIVEHNLVLFVPVQELTIPMSRERKAILMIGFYFFLKTRIDPLWKFVATSRYSPEIASVYVSSILMGAPGGSGPLAW